jgi:hypothetical protein
VYTEYAYSQIFETDKKLWRRGEGEKEGQALIETSFSSCCNIILCYVN